VTTVGREQILEAALDVLTTQGSAALSVRNIAKRAGCSTTGIYTWFGGKDGLIDAIWIDGFTSFAAALRRARGATPLDRLVSQARIYRRWALANPRHYSVMFMGAAIGHEPGPDAVGAATPAFESLHAVVMDAQRAGQLLDANPETVALTVWSMSHGLAAIELASSQPDAVRSLMDDSFDLMIRACVHGLKPEAG
jgi:AcrR family transcriptional regulator